MKLWVDDVRPAPEGYIWKRSVYGAMHCIQHDRPPDKTFSPYRKGSYFAAFYSDELDISVCAGDVDKYHVYKEIVRTIKEKIIEE